MNITKLCLKRPVTTLMFYTAILLLGIISLLKTPKDLLPKINYPCITISTKYLSAAPAEIESLVSVALEEAIATVPGIKNISSVSKEGLSLIYADFIWGTDPNQAVLDIRQKIDSIKEKLPKESEPPLIKKINPFSRPMMEINFAAKQNPEKTLFYINKFIKDKINKTEGVALVKVLGGREKNIFVDVSADRLKAYNVDTKNICDALKNTNLNYPAGNVKSEYYDYVIRTEGRFKNLKDIEDTLVFINDEKEEKNKLIDTLKIKDIATVYEDYPELQSISRLNQQPTIMLSIYKQSDANTIDTADNIKETLRNTDVLAKENIGYQITYDKSAFIKESSKSTTNAGLLGAVLAFLTLLFFLRSYLTAAVAFISLPVSIFACFIFMFFYGISLNLISLSGIALAVGMLVDNAVVVLENIKRSTDDKTHSKKIIADSTKEVSFALLASTLTTVSVFMPLLFLKGLLGALFNSLALVVTFSLLMSLIVSVTLIPRLYLNVKKIKADNKLQKTKIYTDYIDRKYKLLLTKTLKNPQKLLTWIFGLFCLSLMLLYFLPKQIMPNISEGDFVIAVEMQPTSNITNTNKQVTAIEKVLSTEENIKSVSIKIGSNDDDDSILSLTAAQAQITVSTKKLNDKYLKHLATKIKPILFKETNIRYEKISSMQSLTGEDFDFKITLTSFSNLNKLIEISKSINSSLEDTSFFQDIRNNIPTLSEENNVKINKAKAALRGISSDYISISIYTALKGVTATKLTREDKKVPIVVRLSESDRNNITKIKHLPLKINETDTVSLKDVAQFQKAMSPGTVIRKNGLKYIELNLKTKQNVSKAKAAKKIKALLSSINAPSNIEIKLIPKNSENREAYLNLVFMFALALFLIYMIMSAQFESFLNPLLIMLTVPLSIIGVAFGLFLFGKTLNIISILGIIMLCGIAVNNGIILLEYIEKNINAHPDGDVNKTVTEAAALRLRPILITAVTTISGLLPMLFAGGGSGAIKSTLAVTLSFGLLTTTVLTLFVLPVIYIKHHNKKIKSL